MKSSVVVAAIAELAAVALLVMADDFGQGGALQPDQSVLVVNREVRPGDMPAGARNPQLGRISGGQGIDFVVGHDIPRVKGQDASGRLRVYANSGVGNSLSFKNGLWLDDRIPSARTPVG